MKVTYVINTHGHQPQRRLPPQLGVALLPRMPVVQSAVRLQDSIEEDREGGSGRLIFKISISTRLQVWYTTTPLGTSIYWDGLYDYYHKNSFSTLNNGFGTLQIYTGFKLYLKGYRKNKRVKSSAPHLLTSKPQTPRPT